MDDEIKELFKREVERYEYLYAKANTKSKKKEIAYDLIFFNKIHFFCKCDSTKLQKAIDICPKLVYNSSVNFFVSEGREIKMAEVKLREGESLDNALRRFKKQCARSGVLAELRKREHYEKPSVKRKKKSEAARKRKYK